MGLSSSSHEISRNRATTPQAPREGEEWIRGATDSISRLFWRLDGPLTSAVLVMAAPRNPNSCEPYYNSTTGAWHDISTLAVSEARVSSLVVCVRQLENWEDDWLEEHEEHFSPGEEAEEGLVKWGNLDAKNGDDEDDGDDEDNLQLVKCCGMSRPHGKNVKLVVKPSAPRGYVTIQDYLTAVHPWLMNLRHDILSAMGANEGQDEPLPENTELMVNYDSIEWLDIQLGKEWVRHEKGLPVEM